MVVPNLAQLSLVSLDGQEDAANEGEERHVQVSLWKVLLQPARYTKVLIATVTMTLVSMTAAAPSNVQQKITSYVTQLRVGKKLFMLHFTAHHQVALAQ